MVLGHGNVTGVGPRFGTDPTEGRLAAARAGVQICLLEGERWELKGQPILTELLSMVQVVEASSIYSKCFNLAAQ